MFTAIFVSRTLLRVVLESNLIPSLWWLGVDPDEMAAAKAATTPGAQA
jgi:hypothetical protein